MSWDWKSQSDLRLTTSAMRQGIESIFALIRANAAPIDILGVLHQLEQDLTFAKRVTARGVGSDQL